jgi:hypothetical protein
MNIPAESVDHLGLTVPSQRQDDGDNGQDNGGTQLYPLESDQPEYTGSKETVPSTLVDDRDY